MKNVSVKLALFFISLICVSSIISFFMSAIFTNTIEKEIELSQQGFAVMIEELNQKTDLSIEEITEVIPGFMYEVGRLGSLENINITREEIERIHEGEIIFLPNRRYQGTATIFFIEDEYFYISLQPQHNMYRIVAARVKFPIFTYLLAGAILIILFVKWAVKPLSILSSAMEEVAKGNFDIQVENKSKDEIGQLTKSFNKMTKELKNIEYLRKDFITNVSHEFKTPIASIQGFAKLLQKGNLSEDEKQEYAHIIVEESVRLSNLSSNVLKLSKLENQEIIEKKVKFSLDEQIRRSILLLEHQWGKKNIEFDIELNKIYYFGDEELLQQVWINLIGNAIKFSEVNGIIGIHLEAFSNMVRVSIKDDGIGMSEETIHRIFEKFYQGDKARSHEGNGLGLSLVKRIIDLVGGRITVESNLKEGSTFIVELPL
ncbi:HAMP domain-containing sensor histidine kinase [Alkaliphilus transvaalensis]|uniref:HAMP domain-containing sensor histidine kinase n=1 Tax=Alkaliphilus transvaalensis TaxID=114628 RepID=UPI00047BC666|nr:HAMP domain-containing sensor histidine kinase [Alkaliphilus transvaalensis]